LRVDFYVQRVEQAFMPAVKTSPSTCHPEHRR
jgi:hypothetical protein